MTQSILSTAGLYQPPASTTPSKTLGKDEFLKLLVMQLRYQDPLNPLKGTEFAAQLAQFSSVERLQNIEDGLARSLAANQVLSQSINNSLATTMIGKGVRYAGSSFSYDGADAGRFGYSLSSAAEGVTVKIFNASGALVRTLTGMETGAGDHDFVWDGKDDRGVLVAAGEYTVAVSAVDGNGSAVAASPFRYGTVEGVRFRADGTRFVIGGREISIGDVQEISGE